MLYSGFRWDKYGRRFKYVYDRVQDKPVKIRCIGRLYETQPDSRQQPKSLAYKLREELNNATKE